MTMRMPLLPLNRFCRPKASYRNITFASGSEAGQFALNIMSFPTTYVIDRNGKIVGEPVLGGITNENSMKQLQENIDTAIANDGK